MGRIAAIGGGTYEEIGPIIREIIRLSGKEKPNVLFIGTALQDSTNPLTSCKKAFKREAPGCIVKKLSVIRSVYTEEMMDELFSWADVIFCGGGNTAFMLEKWQEFGIDERLKKVYAENSAVLSGISAGAMCWFETGYTDSDSFEGNENWQYRIIHPGFDMIPLLFCPHYNDWARSGFDEIQASEKKQALALEDRTACILDGDKMCYITADPLAHIWSFDTEGHKTMII